MKPRNATWCFGIRRGERDILYFKKGLLAHVHCHRKYRYSLYLEKENKTLQKLFVVK